MRHDYKRREDNLSELKINPAVNKTKKLKKLMVQHVRQMDRDRLPHLIMKYQTCEKRS
jgi:hypothetical protein